MVGMAALPSVSSDGGLSRYLTEIRKFPFLEASEEASYARGWRDHGDREAAYHLVTSHLWLAAKIAMKYRRYGLPIADLVSEANLGLMQAVKRFEPERGFRLATAAGEVTAQRPRFVDAAIVATEWAWKCEAREPYAS